MVVVSLHCQVALMQRLAITMATLPMTTGHALMQMRVTIAMATASRTLTATEFATSLK
jgi:hypothetical protein